MENPENNGIVLNISQIEMFGPVWPYELLEYDTTEQCGEHIGDRMFNEVKYDGNFWHGVTEDCDIALYDDWRDSHMKPAEFINFIDYNRHIMNVKGGSVRNNYKEIYITSVQPPEEIYKNINGEPRKQWERRMNGMQLRQVVLVVAIM